MAKNDPVLRIDQKRDYGVSASSTVFYLNNSNAFFAELSAITADMGTLNAGSIVIGETNKLWLNDDDDGGLAIGGIVKENAPFSISKTGHLTATDVSITAGNGVEINQDGLRIGGAGASALWGGEIKDVNGVGTGVHGLRWYDIAGIPAISILTQKPGTSSPYFRLGRPNDADWMQWDAVGLALSGVITARGGLLGGWTIATDNLYAGSGANRVGMAPGSYPFYAGSETPANANFYVTDAGLVHSIAGDIGGWQIAADGLRSADGAVGMLPGALPFFAGDPFDPAFAVYPNGALIATNATISGIINATAGAINGFLTVGGDPYILIDGETALLKSSNYVAGSTGWQIDSAGDAEFNNLTARGTIKTVVFEKSLITAFAGSQIVAKSASALYEACAVSGTTFVLKVQKQAGAAPFESGDIVRLKDETTDTWATVDAGSDETDYWQYTAAWQYGSTSGILLSAHAVVDYGQTGQGYYIVSADGLLGASAAWALRSHDGAPWLSETTHVYAGTDGRLYAGGGNVQLGNTGIAIRAGDTNADPNSIIWRNSLGQEWARIVGHGTDYDNSGIQVSGVNVGLSGRKVRISSSSGFEGDYISLYTKTIINQGMGTFEDFQVRSLNEEDMLLVDASEDALYFGGSTNAVRIGRGGELTLIGTATRWLDEKGQLSAAKLTSPSGHIVQDDAEGGYYYKTTATTADYIWLNIQLNHDRKHGAAIYPHLHWWQTSATIPNWLLQYRYQKQGAAKTTSWTSIKYNAHAFTYSAGTLAQITTWAAITPPSGDGVSDILQIRIIRDTANASGLFSGSDGLVASVYVNDFDVHKELDALGSATEYTK